jgi:hypothetical protein
MRQVLSWRFVAALGALAGLAFLINAVLVGRDTVASVVQRSGPETRRVDLIALVMNSEAKNFGIRRNGLTRGRITLETQEKRSVTIFPGTPGTNTCDALDEPGGCSLLAETLGDTIVWFALVPTGVNFQIDLPAIESLDGGYAQLVNGWQIPYAPVIDRSRCDTPAESFSEFLREVGRRHTSQYSLVEHEIVSVAC